MWGGGKATGAWKAGVRGGWKSGRKRRASGGAPGGTGKGGGWEWEWERRGADYGMSRLRVWNEFEEHRRQTIR